VNPVVESAVPKPHAFKQANAVALLNQYAARPVVPVASFIEQQVPLKHEDTHALHVNILVTSEFDDTALVKNAVQLANAQFTIVGEFPK
jgi:hypothetical protein